MLNASAATTKKTVKDEAELVAALAEWNAGSGDYEITLAEGTYDLEKLEEPMSANGLLTADATSTDSRMLQICGDPNVMRDKVVIDAKSKGRVFYLNNPSAVGSWLLKNLTVLNGGNADVSSGGGVYAGLAGGFAVENCVFSNCVSKTSGGAIALPKSKVVKSSITDSLFISNKTTSYSGDSTGGGALYFYYGAALTRCTFIGNHCESKNTSGGAVYCAGSKGYSITISDCNFTSNKLDSSSAYRGGALYCSSGATISRCAFTNNTNYSSIKSGGGGGVCLNCLNGTTAPAVSGCTFVGNYAYKVGGAGIRVMNSSASTLVECTFEKNSTSGSGGGVSGAFSIVSNCTFASNATTGNPGAAAYLAEVSTVAACTFVSNTTDNSGGGIYTEVSGSTLRGCTFLGNHAGSSGGGAAGAFACVSNCTFASNWAYSGGGIAGCTNVIDCGFASNYADSGSSGSGGGAAYNSTLFICGITNNSAKFIAGGCCKCKVFDSYLSGNTGKSSGIQGHEMSHFERCEVVAKGNGSGRTFLDCSFNACTFHDCNSAYLFCRHAYVTNCLFVANKENRIFSNFSGGETDNTSFFVNCTFVNNSYDYLASYGSDVPDDKRATFLNCLFDGNGYINSSGNLFVETFGKGYNKDVVSNCFLYTQYSPTGANNINRKTTRQDPRLMGDRDPSRPYAPRRRSCLNGAGLVQDWMASATDLDGHPRLTDGKVAIGAYETTEPVPGMSLLIR